jgi:hypothetical protein
MANSYFEYRHDSGTAREMTKVTDLSSHLNKLLALEDISSDLTTEQELRLVDYVKMITDMSHRSISRRYDHWAEADRAHDLYVPADATNFRNKLVIADTRAISDTVLTYMMAAITGRNPMFQLEGMNRKSRIPAALLERVLHQQMRHNAGEARFAQLFLDSIRYGFAPTKAVWSDTKNTNVIVNADPRRTFPDPRVRAGEVEKMQFIVFSDHASSSALIRSRMYPKIQAFPRMLDNTGIVAGWDAHTWHKETGKGWNIDPVTMTDGVDAGYFKVGRSHIVDECWVALNGHEIGMPMLGTVWMVLTVLDERFIIRAQLSPYGQMFPVTIGGFGFDAHKTHQQSLYDLLLPLHDLGTWLLRSRYDNVQAALNNLIFADPTRVAIHDLVNRNPWGVVRTLPGTKPGDGVFIAQVPDVTRSHWNDIGALSDMKQRLAAASDAQQGMPTGDVRTATEIQRLTQLGSQRLGVLSRVLSATTIRPLVRMMASNIKDSLSFSGELRVTEQETNTLLKGLVDNGYVEFDVADLQGDIEYMVVDGTLPIEPTRSPEMWMSILQTVNQAGLMMQYDTGRMVEEAIRSMGVPDVDQYRIDQDQLKQDGLTPAQQMAVMEKMRGQSTVMPNDQLQQEVQRGNVIPMSQAR